MRRFLAHTSRLAFLLTLLGLIAGCDSAEESGDGLDADGAFMGLSMVSTSNPSVPYVAVHEDGELLGIMADPATGAVNGAVLTGDSGHELVVYMRADGTPERLIVEGYVFVFDNVRATMADVVMIQPDGTLNVARDVSHGFSSPLLEGGGNGTAAVRGGGSDVARVAGAANLGIGIASCTISATLATAGAFFSLGIAAPLAAGVVFGCGSAIASVLAEYQRTHGTTGSVLQDTDAALGRIGASLSVLQCATGNPLGCTTAALAITQIIASDGAATEAARQQEIAQTLGLLQGGGGDVQVTLTWTTTADLDLWVTDPSGERIYYGNRNSASGGQLDIDDVNGFGPENVFWPTGGAPSGTFTVQVDHFSGASPSSYQVTTVVQGSTSTYNGSVSNNETDTVTTFSVSGAQPVSPTPNTVRVVAQAPPVASK